MWIFVLVFSLGSVGLSLAARVVREVCSDDFDRTARDCVSVTQRTNQLAYLDAQAQCQGATHDGTVHCHAQVLAMFMM